MPPRSDALKIGGNALLSRLLGFARDLVIARLFGVSEGTDAFFIALRIPNLLRRLFVEGVFAAACVPVLERQRRTVPPAALRRAVDCLFGTFGLYLFGLSLAGSWAAPLFVLFFAPGFGLESPQGVLAAEMLRITIPYLFFIALTALAGSLLHLHERFGIPAFTPVLLNLSIVGCAFFLAPQLDPPILALAWGIFLGGLVQFLIQLPALKSIELLPKPRFCPRHPAVRDILRGLGPTLLSLSATQVNLLLDSLLASFLLSGSLSWLYYSERLLEFPLGILGSALGILILPRLSRIPHSAPAFSQPIDWGLRWALVLGLPAALGLFVLAEPIVSTLFHSPAFGAADIEKTAQSLRAYALGLVPVLFVKILVPAFLSQSELHPPARAARLALVVKLSLSLACLPLGHVGLALATSFAAMSNATWLLLKLKQSGFYQPRPGWVLLASRVLGASAILGLVLYWIGPGENPSDRFGALIAWILFGVLLYGISFLLLGGRPGDLRGPEREEDQ